MSRQFKKSNNLPTAASWFFNAKWKTQAYGNIIPPKAVKDLNFVERMYYGVMDPSNYSVVPKEEHLVPLLGSDNSVGPRVFDFVADAWSVMNLNFMVACQKGLIQKEGAAFAEMKAIQAYENPISKYTNFIRNALNYYNTNYILNVTGVNNITSYDDYVNHFFKMLENNSVGRPITLSRWLKSYGSSVLDTGLAIKYFDMPIGNDQSKIDQILDHPSFEYFSNLCLNMGFSILRHTPNILLFDISSPASRPYLSRKGLVRLDNIFERRYNRSYIYDMNLLYNNINIYYNKFATRYPNSQIKKIVCKRSTQVWIYREPVSLDTRPEELKLISDCLKIKNLEQGYPFSESRIQQIYDKAKYFQKKFDTDKVMGYISSEFKDQVWNKDHGFHDLTLQTQNTTRTTTGNLQPGETRAPTSNTPSGGSSGGSTSSGY